MAHDEPERFFQKVEVIGDCWNWTASSCRGYGMFTSRSAGFAKNVFAHRWSVMFRTGECAGGMDVDHLCGNKLCVNPCHLEVVSHKENVYRSMRGFASLNAHKDVCVRGHDLSHGAYYLCNGGKSRRCKECHKLHTNKKKTRE